METYEDFTNAINFKPLWIKTEQDWIRYAKHLKYRLVEAKEMLDKSFEIGKQFCSDKEYELLCDGSSEINGKYSHWYTQECQEMMSDWVG